MKGLLLKDLFNLRRTMGLMLVMMLAMGIFLAQSGISFLSTYITVMCGMLVVTTMSYDDQAKWDLLALTLPLSRREIVLGKYATMVVLNACGTLAALAFGIGQSLVTETVAVRQVLYGTYFSLLLGTVYAAICIPAIYQFGTEKARLLMFALLMTPSFLFAMLVRRFPELIGRLLEVNIAQLAANGAAVAIVLLAGSVCLSIRIYNKKEF